MDDASCASVGVEPFFPKEADVQSAKVAKAICARCPVQDRCLEYALSFNNVKGIWGGTTQKERFRIKRQRRTA